MKDDKKNSPFASSFLNEVWKKNEHHVNLCLVDEGDTSGEYTHGSALTVTVEHVFNTYREKPWRASFVSRMGQRNGYM